MEQIVRIPCSSNGIRQDTPTIATIPWPPPSRCICNLPFFNIFSACLLSRGDPSQPTFSSLRSDCRSAGISASSPGISVAFRVPPWVLGPPSSDDTFDANSAFLIASSQSQTNESHSLTPGGIAAIVLGCLIALAAIVLFVYVKFLLPRHSTSSHRTSSKYSAVSQLLPNFPTKRQKVGGHSPRDANWSIDADPDEDKFEILGRPRTLGGMPSSSGILDDPYRPNYHIHNPFNHNLAASSSTQGLDRYGRSPSRATSEWSITQTAWSQAMRNVRSFVYGLPVPWKKGTVAVRETKPPYGFSLDGSHPSVAYDPPLPPSKPTDPRSRSPSGLLHSLRDSISHSRRSSSEDPHAHVREWRNSTASRARRASWIDNRPFSQISFEELSEHYDLDTTGGTYGDDTTSGRDMSVGNSGVASPATVTKTVDTDVALHTLPPLQPRRHSDIWVEGEVMNISNNPVFLLTPSSLPNGEVASPSQQGSPLSKFITQISATSQYGAIPSAHPPSSRRIGQGPRSSLGRGPLVPPAPSGLPPSPPSARGMTDARFPASPYSSPPHALPQAHVRPSFHHPSVSAVTTRTSSPSPPSIAPSSSMYASDSGSVDHQAHPISSPTSLPLPPVAEGGESATLALGSQATPVPGREIRQGDSRLMGEETILSQVSTATLPPYAAREETIQANAANATSMGHSTLYTHQGHPIHRSEIPVWSVRDKSKLFLEEGLSIEERDRLLRRELARQMSEEQEEWQKKSPNHSGHRHTSSTSSNGSKKLPPIPQSKSQDFPSRNLSYESLLPAKATPSGLAESSYSPVEWDGENTGRLQDIFRGEYSTFGTTANADNELYPEWENLKRQNAFQNSGGHHGT